MKKKTRIGLMLVVMAILILALTMPGLAKKPVFPNPNCYAFIPTIRGDFYSGAYVFGALDAYWVSEPDLKTEVLYNYCTGIIPWGEETDIPGWRFLTFDEAAKLDEAYIDCDKNSCYTDQDMWKEETVPIYDPVAKMILRAETFYATTHRNGEFLYYKEYTQILE